MVNNEVNAVVDPRDPLLRIQRLLDPGTESLLVERTDCGMIAATGSIKGNKVVVFASDATIKSGALGVDGSHVIVSAYREAMAKQLPIIGIWHSGGARLSDGVSSLNAFGEVFQAMIMASGCRWWRIWTCANRHRCTCPGRSHLCHWTRCC
jgi:acetyl-CoA/propionyl-CoA carboxylase carboxyl transferase subunit